MILTKKNLWLLPSRICMIQGNAVASNLMFETKKDHKIFLQMWNKYLGGMTEVLNYHLSPTEWIIMFKTKTEEEIIQAYHTQRKKSRKPKIENLLLDPKRMISEHIRIFLSQYVRKTNRRKGRKGTLVMERFRKFILKTHADYEKIFTYISKQVRLPIQPNPKYRANERQYDLKAEIKTDGILRVGNAFYRGVCRIEDGLLGSMRLVEPNNPVLRKFFPKSIFTKKSNNSP